MRKLIYTLLIICFTMPCFSSKWVKVSDLSNKYTNTPNGFDVFDSLNIGIIGTNYWGGATQSDSGTFYVTTTINGGKTWKETILSEIPANKSLEKYFGLTYLSNNHLILFSTNGKVLNSYNCGLTWDTSRINSDSKMTFRALTVSNNRKYAAITTNLMYSNYMFYSQDSCKTWALKQLDSNINAEKAYLHVRVTNEGSIYLKSSYFSSAKTVLNISNDFFNTYKSFLVDSQSNESVSKGFINMVNDTLGFYTYKTYPAPGIAKLKRTVNAGITWDSIGFFIGETPLLEGIHLAIFNDSSYYFDGPQGVYRTTNYGINWFYEPFFNTTGSNIDFQNINVNSKNHIQFVLTRRYLLKYFEPNSSISENMSNTCEANIYPNPCAPGRIVNLKIDKVGNSNADYLLYNEIGTIVSQGNVSLTDGIANITIPDNIANGSYTILALIDSESVYAKISVQR